MNKLGKNKFLTGMAVLFLVAGAAWGLLVWPANSAASEQSAKISKAVSSINKDLADFPGEQNIKQWADQAETLKKRYGKSLKDQLDRDQALGQWFDGIDDNSTFAAFLTPYDDQRQALEKELLDKGVDLGSPIEDKDGKLLEPRTPGFNWIQRSDITRADTHEKEMQAKEMLQKRYNISKAILNAVTADVEKGKTKRRLLDVTFLEKFPFLQMASGVAPDSKAYVIPIDPRRYSGYTGAGGGSGFTEQMLPSNGEDPLAGETEKSGESAAATAKKPGPSLGKTLTFGFAVVMDYHQVPTLLRNLIDAPGGQELNLTIVGLSVFVHDPNPREKVETVRPPPGDDTDWVKKGQQMTADGTPGQVHVYVTCQVFDFDPAAVPAFLKP